MLLPVLLLVATLIGIALFLRGDRTAWRSFKALTTTHQRQRRYRRWAARLWLFFALPAIVGLVLLGRGAAIARFPGELASVSALLPAIPAASRDLLIGLASGVSAGLIVVVVVARLRGGRTPGQIGDVSAMLPRNRTEMFCTAWLSISAGLTEELAFRLYLPLLLAILTGSGVAGVVVATTLFGAMHLYQGWAGVAATTAVGAVLMIVYLASGSLGLVILLHIVIDLSGLVLRPLLTGVWRR